MKSIRHLAAVLAVLAIGVAATLLFYSNRPVPAPDAAYTRLDGTRANVSQLKGKVVLVNFWATTCVVCVREMPKMVATHERFKGAGYETLAVAMSYDPPASVVNFVGSRRLPFTIVIDNTGSVAREFGDIKATPTSVLINKRGEIVKRFVGEPDFEELHALVGKLLAET